MTTSRMNNVKRISILFPMLLGIWAGTAQAQQMTDLADTIAIDTYTDSISYALGMDLSDNLNQVGIKLSPEAFFKALVDGYNPDGQLLMTKEEKEQWLARLNQEAQKAHNAKQNGIGEKNRLKGEAFLAQNAQREEVTTTASGLQYEVVTEGTGPKPSATDEVTVHYTGTLLDGEVFDSSVERGQPATFPLNRVIPGWTEGLQLMNEGSMFKFYIPYHLAYGEMGAPPKIGPKSCLIFEVQLLEIVTKNNEANE